MGHILVGIRDFFSPWTRQKTAYKDLSDLCMGDYSADAFKRYAIQIGINRIANSISLSEFETYENKKLVKKKNWWLLNYEPNKNYNKATFWQEVVHEMVYNPDGALIIQSEEGNLILADSYTLKQYNYEENIYSDITFKDGFKLTTTRKESEVIHLKFGKDIKAVIDDVYQDYGKLIGGTIRNYNRGNAMKIIVKIQAMFDQYKNQVDEDGNSVYDMTLDNLFKERLKGMLSDSDSATPLEDGLEIQEVNTSANTKSGAVTTRDITDTFMDIMNIVADAFLIPRGLMKGDVADVGAMTNNYINYCLIPITEQIESEFNRKLYGMDLVAEGTKLKIDTNTVFTKDPISFASSAEALFRVGAYSINDILKKLGEEEIDEAWANEHYVTKNYGEVEVKDVEEE